MKKAQKTVIIILIVLLLCSTTILYTAAKGNYGNSIDLETVIKAQKVVAELHIPTEEDNNALDFSRDGIIDLVDVVLCQKYIAQIIDDPYLPNPNNPYFPELKPLTESEILEIKEAWLLFYELNGEASDLSMKRFYGNYNEAVAVANIFYSDSPALPMVWQYEIAGYTFNFADSNEGIIIYVNGVFMDMQDAYEKNILSETDISAIHYYHTSGKFVGID